MPHFQVIVEITGLITHHVEAATQAEAETIALSSGENNLSCGEVTDRHVYDTCDESAEYGVRHP